MIGGAQELRFLVLEEAVDGGVERLVDLPQPGLAALIRPEPAHVEQQLHAALLQRLADQGGRVAAAMDDIELVPGVKLKGDAPHRKQVFHCRKDRRALGVCLRLPVDPGCLAFFGHGRSLGRASLRFFEGNEADAVPLGRQRLQIGKDLARTQGVGQTVIG